MFILSVSRKQLALSIAARDSMFSLYAADSGIECMAATSIATTTGLSAQCNGLTSNTVPFNSASDPTLFPGGTNVFRATGLVIALPNSTCAVITVTDGDYMDGMVQKFKTVVDSRGYNYCDNNGPKISSRTVERALRLSTGY